MGADEAGARHGRTTAPWTTGLTVVAAWAAALAVSRRLRRVTGPSMLPVLEPGDLVLTAPTWLVRPRPGRMVTARDPRRPRRETVKLVERIHDDGALELRGANPGASTDSRHFGPVPPGLVTATVVARVWPWRRRPTATAHAVGPSSPAQPGRVR